MKRCVVLLVLGLSGSAAPDPGTRAFHEGRFADAAAAFAAIAQDLGRAAPAGLLWNQALAALAANQPLPAEIAAERAVARGGAAFRPFRDFVLGSVAWQRSLDAEAATLRPGAGPSAYAPAIALAEIALSEWRAALLARPPWPEASRNIERALRRLAVLRARQEEAKKNETTKPPAPRPRPTPRPRDPASKPGDGEETRLRVEGSELAPGQLRRIVDRLREKQAEKARLRAERTSPAAASTERDW